MPSMFDHCTYLFVHILEESTVDFGCGVLNSATADSNVERLLQREWSAYRYN